MNTDEEKVLTDARERVLKWVRSAMRSFLAGLPDDVRTAVEPEFKKGWDEDSQTMQWVSVNDKVPEACTNPSVHSTTWTMGGIRQPKKTC